MNENNSLFESLILEIVVTKTIIWSLKWHNSNFLLRSRREVCAQRYCSAERSSNGTI